MAPLEEQGVQAGRMDGNMNSRQRQLVWRRERGRTSRYPPRLPPLLAWVQGLICLGAAPPEAAHVALRYLQVLEEMRCDSQLDAIHRKRSAQLLCGTVSRSWAHSFMHLVLDDV